MAHYSRPQSQARHGGRTPQMSKTNGFINLRKRQDDLYNSGMPGENPF